ncbi:MAG TPA: class I SAM-dependent methyltransferase [Thermoanaerobaculia bacterium]|nr:class I SAM-dependent methyltransferase [Thermoanaerobaculia bacterium]
MKLRSYIGSRFWGRTFAEGSLRTWMHEAIVREYINESVTGSPKVWPIEWLRTVIQSPFTAAVSIGCGEGALERDLLSKGLCTSILGIDLSTEALQLAEAKARAQGLTGARYERGDMNALDLPEAAFDAAFFHQALHHAEELDSCLSVTAAALLPGALVYIDEYVGPSRGEWSFSLIEAASEIFAQLPPSVRRSRSLKLPVDWRDPTEAVRSSEILDALHRHFDVLERHDYGGNFLAVIHPHLRLEHLTAAERTGLLKSVIDAERAHLAAEHPTYYTVILARPLASAQLAQLPSP